MNIQTTVLMFVTLMFLYTVSSIIVVLIIPLKYHSEERLTPWSNEVF